MTEVPMITTWKGTRIEDLKREELYSAITQLGQENQELRQQNYRYSAAIVRTMRRQDYMEEFYPTPRSVTFGFLMGLFLGAIATALVVVLIW